MVKKHFLMESFLFKSLSYVVYAEVMLLYLQKLGKMYPSLRLCDFGYLNIASGFPTTQLYRAEHQASSLADNCTLHTSEFRPRQGPQISI